jgi:hypothetical protein
MADTTSIDDLPTDPSSGNQNNLMIQKTEMNNGMRGGGGMGGMGGMGDSSMMSNQMMPPAQVYSPNVTGVNMMNGVGGGRWWDGYANASTTTTNANASTTKCYE